MVFLPEQFTIIVEDHVDCNEQTLTGMLKYGFTMLLIRLHNSDNTILKESNFTRVIFQDFGNGNVIFLTFARIKFNERTKKAVLVVTKKYCKYKKLHLDFKALTLSCCCYRKNSKARGEHFIWL